MNRIVVPLFLFCAISLVAPQLALAVTIDWATVGNPDNAADPATSSLFGVDSLYGAVSYTYNIDKYEVTNSQYVEFLNAKATGGDPLNLYNSAMSNVTNAPYSGIRYDGSTYSVVSGRENHPVNYVTWYDTIRFANWLNNGQGSGDTESGAYTLLGGTPVPSNANSITRNAGATVFLASQDEWYKAAYYNPDTSSYFEYPTSSNTAPTATNPTTISNSANYNEAVGNLTDVGAYGGTTSPYGAFDMGGNVEEWNEALISDSYRGVRGGSFYYDYVPSSNLLALNWDILDPTHSNSAVGFRVVEVPEPNSGVLAIVACGMMWWCRKRRFN